MMNLNQGLLTLKGDLLSIHTQMIDIELILAKYDITEADIFVETIKTLTSNGQKFIDMMPVEDSNTNVPEDKDEAETIYEIDNALTMGSALNDLAETILRDSYTSVPLGDKHNQLIALLQSISDNLEVAKDLIKMVQ